MTDYESLIFQSLGQCGLFQLFVFISCNLGDTPAAWSMTLMSFAGASPDWWTIGQFQNTTGNSTANESQPIRRYKSCPTSPDEKIEFSSDISTIVSEWNLVCENDWIPSTISTIQMSGVLVGAFFISQLGDLIGRKKSFVGVFFFMMLFTFISSFSINWQMFAAFRFLIGFCLGGYLIVGYTLPIEYIGTKWRTIAGSCPAWAIGVALLGPGAWLIQDWRKLSLATSGIGGVLLLTYFFIPESCRWLLSRGRIEEAEKILKTMAKLNKKPVPDLTDLKQVIAQEKQEKLKEHKYSLLDIFRHWSILRKVLILAFMFFSVVLGYYGFTLGVDQLAGDRYLNMFLNGLVEGFAVLSVAIVNKCLHRKKGTMSFFLMAGLFSSAIAVSFYIAEDELFKKLQNIFALIAKFALSGAFTCLFLVTAESFPTVIRNLGFGAVSTTGRFGGLLAPQIIYLHKISVAIPYVICGTLLTASGLLCFLIKDTYGEPLQDELDFHNKKLSAITEVSLNDIRTETPKLSDGTDKMQLRKNQGLV